MPNVYPFRVQAPPTSQNQGSRCHPHSRLLHLPLQITAYLPGRSPPDCERTRMPEIGRVLAAFTMREGDIQAWQQDWTRKLAHSARQRWMQWGWDQLPGSYLNESWSFVR